MPSLSNSAFSALLAVRRLMLLYPHQLDLEGQCALAHHRLNITGADERLTIASIDVATIASLKALVLAEVSRKWRCLRARAPMMASAYT